MAATTWNPADQLTTALSGGNLVATFTGAGTSSAVRSVLGVSSGKYYFEVTYNSPLNPTWGMALASVSLSAIGAAGAGTAVAGTTMLLGQFVYVGTTLQVNMGTAPVNGNVGQCAVDLGGKLVWFRLGAGNWNNSGTANPATGAGGFSISSIATGPLYACCGGANASGFTANFGGSAFTFTPPSGYAGLGTPTTGRPMITMVM